MYSQSIFPPPLLLQPNIMLTQSRINYSSLETKILSQINYIRTNPQSYFNYYKNNFNEKFILNIMNNFNKLNQKLIPFITKREISLAGRDYLNYLIENKIPKVYFNINKDNKSYYNLKQRLAKYGQKKGKVFELVITNSSSAEEIVNKLIKEEKSCKMILNPNMKYIGITCGFIPEWNNICVIIDIIEDFIEYNNYERISNNGIQILDEFYLDENIAQIENKFKARTHKANSENKNKNKFKKNISRNYDEMKFYNTAFDKNEKYKAIFPDNKQEISPFNLYSKNENIAKSFSFNTNFNNFGKTFSNKFEINNINSTSNIKKEKDEKIELIHSLNTKNNKLTSKNSENNIKEYKITTKNVKKENNNITNNPNLNFNSKNNLQENNIVSNDKINNISFENNNSFFSKENSTKIKDDIDNNENTFQIIETINDISNVNQTKKQNSFFSLDTEISTILYPKKNDSQELNKNKSNIPLNQDKKENKINIFEITNKENLFKNNRREIKNLIKLYNKERMAKKEINNRNQKKNNDLKDVKSTATFFYFNSENKDIKTQKVYQKRKPNMIISKSNKNIIKTEIKNNFCNSFYKDVKTEVYTSPKKIEKKIFFNTSKNINDKILLFTENNIPFNNSKKRIISFKANRKIYKNKSFEKNKDDIKPMINNNDVNDKYKGIKRHIEEINIDLSNYYKNNIKNNNRNINNYIYKKNKAIDDKNNRFNFYCKTNSNIKTEESGKYNITNIGNISNTIQNTIKNKYIIINT